VSGVDFLQSWSLVGAMGIVFGLLVASVVWTVWMFRRRRQLSGAARGFLYFSTLGLSLGGLGTLVGLIKAFGAVGGESVDPSRKVVILVEGISEAMNGTAFALLLWMLSAIVVAILGRKRGPALP
jgi:hypothetical protein